MKRLGLLFIFSALAIGFGAMVGCSGSGSTDSNLVQGDTTDAAFQIAQDLVGDEGDIIEFTNDVELSLELFFQATSNQSATPGQAGRRIANAASSADSISNIVISDWQFTQENWFVCSFSATQYEYDCGEFGCDSSVANIEGIDSLQFLILGDPLDTAQLSNGFDEVRVRTHVSLGGSDEMGDVSADLHRWVNMAEDTDNDSLVNVNAGSHDTLALAFEGDSASCDIIITENGAIDNIVVLAYDGSGECPRSGSASKTATISLACLGTSELEQLDIEGAWTVNADVKTDGSVQVSYTDGTTQWVTTIEAGGCN